MSYVFTTNVFAKVTTFFICHKSNQSLTFPHLLFFN